MSSPTAVALDSLVQLIAKATPGCPRPDVHAALDELLNALQAFARDNAFATQRLEELRDNVGRMYGPAALPFAGIQNLRLWTYRDVAVVRALLVPPEPVERTG